MFVMRDTKASQRSNKQLMDQSMDFSNEGTGRPFIRDLYITHKEKGMC